MRREPPPLEEEMTFDFSGRPTWQFLRDETGTVIREHIHRWRWRTLRNSETNGIRHERGPLAVQCEHGATRLEFGRLWFVWCAVAPANSRAHGHPNKWMIVWRRNNPVWRGSLLNPDKYPMPWTIVRRRLRGARCLFFLVRLRPLPGVDAIRALRAALKTLLRRYGLRCESVEIEKLPQSPKGGANG